MQKATLHAFDYFFKTKMLRCAAYSRDLPRVIPQRYNISPRLISGGYTPLNLRNFDSSILVLSAKGGVSFVLVWMSKGDKICSVVYSW